MFKIVSQIAYTCRIQNPDIQQAGWVGAAQSGAERGQAGQDADRTVGPGDNSP